MDLLLEEARTVGSAMVQHTGSYSEHLCCTPGRTPAEQGGRRAWGQVKRLEERLNGQRIGLPAWPGSAESCLCYFSLSPVVYAGVYVCVSCFHVKFTFIGFCDFTVISTPTSIHLLMLKLFDALLNGRLILVLTVISNATYSLWYP